MIFAEGNNSLLTQVAKHNSLILFVGGCRESRKFKNVAQLKQAGMVRFVAAVHWWHCSIDQCSVGCSVGLSYKRMMDILNTNLNSLDVFTAALLFSYRH